MLRPLVFASALVGAAVIAGAASAEPYISASIGGSFRSIAKEVLSSNTDPNGNSVTQNGVVQPYEIQRQTRFNTGLDAEVAAGFRFNVGLGDIRTEIAVDYGETTPNITSGQSLPSAVYKTTYSGQASLIQGGQFRHGAVTINAFYDLPRWGPVIPYIGAGVGYYYGMQAAATFSGTDVITGGGVTLNRTGLLLVNASQTHEGVYLGEIGLTIPVTKTFSIVPAYRYSQLFNGQVPTSLGKVGVRYNFF